MMALRKWFAAIPGWARIVGIVAGALVVVIAVFWPFADLIAEHDVGSVGGRQRAVQLQTARDAARGRMIQVGGGLFAVLALTYTALNFRLAQQGHVTDRYTKAIEQLGSGNLDVRIGGMSVVK